MSCVRISLLQQSTQKGTLTMDYSNHTTEHKKFKHLSYEELVIIQLRLKDGWSAYRIAREELHCAPNTVRNAIRNGATPLYNGKVTRFKAKTAWENYCANRQRSQKAFETVDKRRFLKYVSQHVREDHWSLDACCGRALVSGEFDRSEIVCTKTLYNYVDLGFLDVKNIDLPQKLRRKTKTKKNRENKRILGRGIEERPESVQCRNEFGHWETDLVLGKRSGTEEALLTLIERKTRNLLIYRLSDKSADSVMTVFKTLREDYGEHFSRIFRTITTDNGSEFSRLSELETLAQTLVYFAHPYTSCEKGTIENHNGLIRKFIRKGKCISDYSANEILYVELWANQLPRKILGYRTPEELFEAEMDALYAA